MHRHFIIFTILVFTQAVSWAGSPVAVKKFAAPPKIDGVLDDTCWRETGWRSGFTSLVSGEKITPDSTWFKLGYDRDNLYLAVRCKREGIETMSVDTQPRDSAFWTSESVEFFLAPSADGKHYYQLIFTPWEQSFDAKCTANALGDIANDISWNPNLRLKTKITKNRWEAELAIPWNQMDLSQAGKGPWGYNLCVNCKTGKKGIYTFTPTTDLHDMKSFAKITIPEKIISRYRYHFCPPDQMETRRCGDAYQMRAINFLLISTANKLQKGGVILRARWADAGETTDTWEAFYETVYTKGYKWPKRFSVELPASRLGEHTLEMSVISKKSNKNNSMLLHQDRMKVNLEYAPLRLEITQPYYRNTIYATQNLKAIEGNVFLQLDKKQRNNSRLEIVFHKKENSAKTIQKAVISKLQPTIHFQLPINSLQPGDYILSARLVSSQNESVATVDTPIFVTPPVKNEWRLDENHVLLHNGKPFLPLGYYGSYKQLKPGEVCNAAMDYALRYKSDEYVEKFLTDSYRRGVYVMTYPYPQRNRIIRPLLDVLNDADTNREHLEAIAQRVRKFRNHPGLLAWYMADEPRATPAIRKRLRQVYEICRREDPYHPCIFLTCRHTEFAYFTGCEDINMPDPYPHFLKGGLSMKPITRVTQEIHSAREAGKGRLPVWVVPQAFSYADYKRMRERAPTFTELRNIVYQGVIAEAKGFIAFKLAGRNKYVGMRLGYPFVYEELNHLKPFVLAGDAGLAKSDNKQILVTSRQVGDQIVIFAVNVATNNIDGKITLKGPAAKAKRWKVFSEARGVDADSNAIRDSFDVYATHVYVTENVSELPRRLTDVDSEIKKCSIE